LSKKKEDEDFDFQNDIFWDEVTAINTMGLKPVYDLTIPDTHNFVANDICVHNTSFAMNIAEYVAIEKQIPVAVFSMEMSDEQLTMRLMSSLAQVNLQSVRTGQLNDDEWFKITKTVSQLEKASLFIDQTPALNPTELRARVRRLAREQGQLGLVVIDYLQLMQVPENKESRANEVSEISRSLKSLAKELNVPVIALSQLNRSLEQRSDRRPKMSDLRESGCLAGDSLVTCADTGRQVPIRDLVGQTDFSVWGLNTKTMKLERAKISRAFCTGIKPVFRLTTRLGRTICATLNHQFYTPYGWKRLDELNLEDYLALPHPIYAGMILLNNRSRERFAQSDIYWDKIARIEPAGEEEVFDLTVPQLQNFLCNSLILHNSLEQDADLIAFIYRDEVYNEDTPDKDIAEIIVAKQRNGPIGMRKLYFRKQTTKFENFTEQYEE
jgi:replicative DNA helicase